MENAMTGVVLLLGILGCDIGETVKSPNSDPLCTITEPLADAEFVVGESISFAGTATDADIDNSLLSVSWESDVDGVLDTPMATVFTT